MIARILFGAALLFVAGGAIGAVLFATVADSGDSPGRVVRFEGASMEPAFCASDYIVFEPYDGEIERWQVVLFKFPLDPERDFIKRVIALPGETVEVRDDGLVYVDGDVLDGDVYPREPANYTFGPKTVPSDSYFVLGDNRRNSYDSHAWGASSEDGNFTVPDDSITGELPADATGC